PWSLAAEPRRAAPARTTVQAPSPGVLSLTAWLGSWLRSLWGEEGLGLDPNGISTVPPAPGPAGGSEAGADIDPDGFRGKSGLNIDPNGHTDHAGLSIDP